MRSAAESGFSGLLPVFIMAGCAIGGSGSGVEQGTGIGGPGVVNIGGTIEATTAREKLGRLTIPYSVQGFIDSAKNGDTTAVKLFVEAGMNVESKEDNYGRTALMEAAQDGHLDTIEALIRKKAEVNAQDKSGDTALILAASRGQLEVVRTLLKKHAEPNTQNTTGRTALREAAENGHKLVVLALLDNGAQLEIRDKGEQKTPLLAAAMLHQTDIVKLLLDRGADANARDKYGHSSLIPAARAGHFDMVKALLSHGADVNAADKDGRTALMGAAGHGHSELITLLLEYKADLKLVDKEGKTALMWAESRGHNVIIELLRKAADAHAIESQNQSFLTPQIVLCEAKELSVPSQLDVYFSARIAFCRLSSRFAYDLQNSWSS